MAQLKNYRIVSCVRCGEPIPLCEKVVTTRDETTAFIARCRLCESVYLVHTLSKLFREPRRQISRRTC